MVVDIKNSKTYHILTSYIFDVSQESMLEISEALNEFSVEEVVNDKKIISTVFKDIVSGTKVINDLVVLPYLSSLSELETNKIIDIIKYLLNPLKDIDIQTDFGILIDINKTNIKILDTTNTLDKNTLLVYNLLLLHLCFKYKN